MNNVKYNVVIGFGKLMDIQLQMVRWILSKRYFYVVIRVIFGVRRSRLVQIDKLAAN